MMQKREKILAAIFGAVILIWLGMPVIDSTFIEPVESRQNQLKVLNQQIDQREQKELEFLRSAGQLGNWVAHSLPPDEHDAQRLYLEWLDDLAELSGFTELKLSPGRRIRERKTYVAIQVSLEGTATYEQVCQFLLHFYQTELLQNIIGLELKSTGTGKANRLEIKLTAEGLALTKAKPREQLFPRAKLAVELNTDDKTIKVQTPGEFPSKVPFRIRIDREFMTVKEIDGDTWSVERGVNNTVPAQYSAGAPFELSTLNQFSEGSTKLKQSITKDSQLINVLSTTRFPKDQSFLINIDNEILNVTNQAVGEWTVQRGVLDTKAAAHSQGAMVKQVPQYLQAVFDYKLIAPVNPFMKPVPDKTYKLKLNDITKQSVVKGSAFELKIPLEGVNPSMAAPEWKLKSDLSEMSIQSGKLKWAPSEAQKSGVYPVTITAVQGDQTVEKNFEIELREKNRPPKIEAPTQVTAYQGRPLSIALKATDSDIPSQKLKFELEAGALEGITINLDTGEINWTPTVTTELKDYPISIKVSDSGTPPLSTSQKVNVKVVLDDAFFTFLTGSIAIDGQRVAWIRNRATNQKQEIRVGDTIDVSDIHAVVKMISDQFLVLDIDGKPWTLSLGENFRTMRNLSASSVLN